MGIAIVTGSGEQIGSESVCFFAEQGFDVIGVENDMRARFFGPEASTAATSECLAAEIDGFRSEQLDIRDAEGVMALFARHARDIELIVHTAVQPSHDWAASDTQTDFTVNANGTLNLLQAREHTPDATFVFTSTNKVYGDRPNDLPLQELDTRLELPEGHRWYGGIDTEMSIDLTTHWLFGVSKAAAGGGRESNVSMLEAIDLCQRIAGRELDYTLSEQARIGDHRWWISDLDQFKADHPQWGLTFGIEEVLRGIYEHNIEQWTAMAR